MEIEAIGKSVEIAIQNGLLMLGKKREEVEVKVIDNGGLFKKAKVVLSYSDEVKTNEEVKEEPKTIIEVVEEPKDIQPEEKIIKKKVVDTTRLEEKGKSFLLGLASILDENAVVEAVSKENEISFSVKGEKLGKLIGYHGENIQALQMLLSGLKTKGEGAVRMYLDIDGYKQNRNQTIIDLANKIAEQAVKIERNIHLDPMNAYDRRIVHNALTKFKNISTQSEGVGNKRHIVISYKD